MLELNKYYNMDCMDALSEFPDGFFDIAIVDPPYGCGNNTEWENAPRSRFGGRFAKYEMKSNEGKRELGCHFHGSGRSKKYVERTVGSWSKKYGQNINHWDIAPPQVYFDELFRVSKNQIIWGGNYFDLPPTRCFVIWQKLTISENFTMAMCEYAWTSFNDNAKLYAASPQGTKKDVRFHPTQKPVELYTWLLNKYAKPGDKILDTHVGSASSLVACQKLGFEYVGFEIDKDYWQLGIKRLQTEREQMSLFEIE